MPYIALSSSLCYISDMSKEKMRFVGFRLYEKHRAIIRKWARNLGISESEVVRRAVEHFKNEKQK